MAVMFRRASGQYVAPSGGGSWEDVTVPFSSMGPQFATNGRKVRIDLTGGDYGLRIDVEGGASSTEMPTSAYDGTMAILLRPPTTINGSNPDATYCGIANGIDLWNGGTLDIAQGNIGFCLYYASRYIDLAATAKIGGVVGAQSVGGSTSATESRAAIYENTYNSRRVPYALIKSFGYYPGIFPETQPNDHICRVGTSANHANTPVYVGQEWMYIEQEVDYRRNRGNADGRNKIYLWLRDGTFRSIEAPLNYNPDWDYSWQYAAYYEFIGGLFNNASTGHADNYFMVSHPIAAVNRSKDDPIGPPTGSTAFLT